MASCTRCDARICRDNKSGLCRSCINKDPDFIARRSKAIRRAFMADPLLREKHRRAVAEANRRPERRERSGEQARRLRLWEHGLPKITAEVRKRQGAAQTERRLAHIPLERRDEYRVLAKKYGAAEASRIIIEHQEVVLRRGRA